MGRKLNTSTPTVIQTELVPLDENFAIQANGTLEQWYYDNNTQYAPDRSITPLILTPFISVADRDSQQSWDNEHVVKSVVAWSVMEDSTWVDINSSSALADYELSGNNLIVHKNVPFSKGVTIRCVLTYVDPRDNGIYVTTQETVLLTCNRDSNVVLPEVAITSPSARSFNPLVDGSNTEYDFDAIVSNSPDVEMQSSDIAAYGMDGTGTEEIVSDANGVAPILDIRYPDSETQTDQEFAYRQTANGEKTDEKGSAFISKIKGNTVAWNQLCNTNNIIQTRITATINGNFLDVIVGEDSIRRLVYEGNSIQGHKYYIFLIVKNTYEGTIEVRNIGLDVSELTPSKYIETNQTSIFKKIITQDADGDSVGSIRFYTANSTCSVCFQTFDLTLIYGAGNEPETVEEFEADYLRWFGKPLSYEPYDAGSLRPVLMQSVKTTGFNLWDEEWEIGDISSSTGENVQRNDTIRTKRYNKAIGGETYYNGFSGTTYLRFYDANKNFLSSMSANGNSTFIIPSAAAFFRFMLASTYGTTYNNDICINISNPSKNGTYEPYEEHIASVPVTSAKGKLLDSNGSPVGNSVLVFPDGLKKAGNVQDEIFVENGVIKAIKRVGSVDLGSLNWSKTSASSSGYFTEKYGMYIRSTQEMNLLTPLFVAKYANEKGVIYGYMNGQTAVIVVPHINDVYPDVSSFTTAMNGVMLYYELKTPQTYVLDPVQNPFIYKWFGIDANNNEVLAETLPWYVSGQDTSKLKVDAMWGEKINVVLRAMMPNGVLSPSRAYAALTWRIPDVETTVLSQNGSAVRSNTTSMTFGTIVNIKGKAIEDSVKAAHLRFKWVYRKNTTDQETVAGWSQGESDQITIQASNLRSVRAQDSTLTSTLVFPYVYCLGAWTTSQGTETGYNKPTTTKNGVTYYRIID